MKKKKKHKPCSYMQLSPDGRRKTTIKLQKEKERMDFTIQQMDKFAKEVEYFSRRMGIWKY